MNCVIGECVLRVCALLIALPTLPCQYTCTCVLKQIYTPIVGVTVRDVAHVATMDVRLVAL